MKAYFSFFKIRFINGLQYRSAAYAGIATQFAFGFMYIMLYHAFYNSNPDSSPMSLTELSTYIWLQQSFLALLVVWFLDNDIFESISNGNVSYEICRPLDIYNMWFIRNCATRLSKTVLRCLPILIIAILLPETYRFRFPQSLESFMLFTISIFLSLMLVVSYGMIIYICTFYTVSSVGVRMTFVMIGDFLSGGLIPLPLLPEYLNKYIYLSPFAGMMNTPFRIYTGGIPSNKALISIGIQVFWIIVLIFIGKSLMRKSLKKVVVQGG